MASPQSENGHTDIANELMEHLATVRLPGQEWQILFVLLRKTWGWKKKEDRIALSQFSQLTGIDRRKCHTLLKSLIKKKLVKKTVTYIEDRKHISYGFNKNYEIWKLSPKKVTVTHIDDKVSPKKRTDLSPKKAHTKETRTKETTKETPLPPWLDVSLWNDFKEHRKACKSKMTPLAEDRAIKKLSQFKEEGYDPEFIINQSIEMGWKGLFKTNESKKNGSGQGNGRTFWDYLDDQGNYIGPKD